nr:hypothetical protein [Tanacetum cinerariifolium]
MSNHNRIYVTPSHTKKIFKNKGSAHPTDPHHPPTIIQPSISQPKKPKQHRKPRRKVTKVPQPSDPTSVTDEAVNEEMDDSLEWVATTATSLDAEQDKGGGPKCQETMGYIVAQTRSKRASKISNDPLLAGVNTPQSGEDSLKLTELMELCTKLQQRVFDLETTKTTQALEIESLKRRVKKLERRKRFGKEDASKQERIADIDSNEDIYLVNVHKDKDIFGVNDLDGDEVIVKDADMLFDVADDLRGEEVFVSQEISLKKEHNVMTSLADKTILSGADNRPLMLEKDMYDSWKSIRELYMLNRQHGRMILESVENGPLLWPIVEENGVTRPKKYFELSATEAI